MAVTSFRRSIRDEGGQAAVEFALVIPFLLIMLVGIVEFGRAWNEHQVITDAARETARSGVPCRAPSRKPTRRRWPTTAMLDAGIDTSKATINFPASTGVV